jgi:hypothetical protein
MVKKAKGFGDAAKKREMANKLGAEDVFWRLPRNEQPDLERNWDEQEKRIGEIVGFDSEGEVKDVNDETLSVYGEYLNKNLQLPCYLTGIEDFSWEEMYVFGYGSKKKYEELKKTRASYLDTFKLLNLITDFDMWSEIGVYVQRMEDGKKFELPLSELEATDRLSINYQLLDDYSCWFVNFR